MGKEISTMKARTDPDGRNFFEVRAAAEVGSWNIALLALSSLQADKHIRYDFDGMMKLSKNEVYSLARDGLFQYGTFDALKRARQKWTNREILVFADHIREMFPEVDFDMTYGDYFEIADA